MFRQCSRSGSGRTVQASSSRSRVCCFDTSDFSTSRRTLAHEAKFSFSFVDEKNDDVFIKELNNVACKSYLLACQKSKQAMLVDPLLDYQSIYMAFLAYHNLKLVYTIDTHTHADHVTATHGLKRLTGAQILMHRLAPSPYVDVHLEGGEKFRMGLLDISFIKTPGHTPDSLCIFLNRIKENPPFVFTGDTLLIGGSGRTDFPGGDSGQSYDSIVNTLFKLPDDTVVLPGHDYKGNQFSTIGIEKVKNSRVVGKTKQEYGELMSKLFSLHNLPEKIHFALQSNQAGLQEYEQSLVSFPPVQSLVKIQQISSQELMNRLNHDDVPPFLVDIREEEEVIKDKLGRISGSQIVKMRELKSFAEEVKNQGNENKPIVIVCRSGIRSQSAVGILNNCGLKNVASLKGGILEWEESKFPTSLPNV